MTWSFGILPAWTRRCRLSDRSSPVSGEFTSEKHRISTQLLNMWRITFVQTSSALAAFVFAKVYTNSAHTHLLCFIEPHVNSVASSFLFIQNEPFQSRWPSYVSVCVCLFCVSPVPSTEVKFFFWLWEPVRWAGAGLRLLTEKDATFNVITGWPHSMLEWQKKKAGLQKESWPGEVHKNQNSSSWPKSDQLYTYLCCGNEERELLSILMVTFPKYPRRWICVIAGTFCFDYAHFPSLRLIIVRVCYDCFQF